jgi:hypothetical protein
MAYRGVTLSCPDEAPFSGVLKFCNLKELF